MIDGLPYQSGRDETERNAYNAAFYELGFRWHWDGATYGELLRHSSNSTERIRHYLETRQPHLLRAYDADFLVSVIQETQLGKRCAASSAAASGRHFDWAESLGSELGA